MRCVRLTPELVILLGSQSRLGGFALFLSPNPSKESSDGEDDDSGDASRLEYDNEMTVSQ